MKKIALLMALLMLVFSLAACGEKTDDPQNTAAAGGATTEAGEFMNEEQAACVHQYVAELVSEATCTEKGVILYTCSVCEHSYTEETTDYGHEGTGASCVEASICTVCGEVVEEAWGHVDENGICKNCGISMTEAEFPVSVEPTQPTDVTEGTESTEAAESTEGTESTAATEATAAAQ